MGYATLMVHLDPDRTNAGPLATAGELARRFQSRVVGIATGRPVVYIDGDGYVSGDVIQQNLFDMNKRIDALEAEFRAAFVESNTAIEWRSKVSYEPLGDYLSLEARCADLILTGSPDKRVSGDAGALVLQAGRPVLVIPASIKAVKLDKAVICWKETREARRAVVDALDLLKQAVAVDVVEVISDDDMPACRARLQDVIAWLALHGISAMPVATSAGNDVKATLSAVIKERGGDLVVAGAYGHSRLREWVLGGVTSDLWMKSGHCSLLSH